ncbi:cytochrome b562 [Acinetobacter sp. S40]|uniref:cytochrome b562 n=1 Tax=unclassified Acinetobacter TaxID=196816 RepID=UPI00190DD5DC|nr:MULTISPECIES: cytochrome b562 [unclassified Acinetobacter]MBJ9986784.1 cytochrome b562 [Acinetobacter sp. S40]MBK0065147.1 cytochrome b562 [Acinetobacter sp. S55]MBK0068316.1 cytochrome b562 [Acinetobacter sp. S54]
MKKVWFSALFLGCFGFSHLATAATLHDNMVTIATAYADFNKSTNGNDANSALTKMRLAALDSKKSKPNKLKNQPDNSAEVKAYQAGLDQLVAEIDKTSGLVKDNQLAQAKVEAKNLLDIRNENHKKFK